MSIKQQLMNSISSINKEQLMEEVVKKSLPANKKTAIIEATAIGLSLVLGDLQDVALTIAGVIGFNQVVARTHPIQILQETMQKVDKVNSMVTPVETKQD